MRKQIYITMLALLPFTAMAEEMCLISTDAEKVETNYNLSDVQTVTIDTKSGASSFSVNLKDGVSKAGGVNIRFGVAIPTSTPEELGAEDATRVIVYSNGGTVYVEAEKECDIMFSNISGQPIKESVRATKCECRGLQPGIYIVRAGRQSFSIQVQ